MYRLSDLKQTKVYQEAFAEGQLIGKLKVVPRLLAFGLTVEQIAEALGLSLEQVRQVAQNQHKE